MTETDPKTGKPVVSSAGKFLGMNTIYGRDGEHGSPYMTRIWFWGLRLHIFHRPDLDEDCHDHPWDFWTIPLWPIHGYVEEVAETVTHTYNPGSGAILQPPAEEHHKSLQIVPGWWPSFRPAEHCHRVLGAYKPGLGHVAVQYSIGESGEPTGVTSNIIDPNRKIVTLVWRGKARRSWGFLKNRAGEWCWVAWRDYVFAGGKDGPCQ